MSNPTRTDPNLLKKIQRLEAQLAEKTEQDTVNKINQRRLQALWNLSSMMGHSFKTVCDTLLDEIVAMSDSQYGFYGFINPDETEMEIYSWSKDVFRDCRIHDKPVNFPITASGIWGNAIRQREPLIYNRYDTDLPNQKGTPEGHTPILRILSVPVFSNRGKIVALGCVSNKKEDYVEGDLNQLASYLNHAQLILQTRKKEEENKVLFEKAVNEVKILRGLFPICSACKKIRDDKGYWERIESYIEAHSEAKFSHSICPECTEKLYGDQAWYKEIIKPKDK